MVADTHEMNSSWAVNREKHRIYRTRAYGLYFEVFHASRVGRIIFYSSTKQLLAFMPACGQLRSGSES